jgi:hypothetical protein
MSFQEILQGSGNQAEQAELAYQRAVQTGRGDEFAAAMESRYSGDPDNLLYAAWHYRLAYAASAVGRRAVAWGWAIPLAVLNGLLIWLLSDDQRFTISVTSPISGYQFDLIPAVALLAAPVSAAVISVFLTAAGKKSWPRALAVIGGLAVGSAYVLLMFAGIWPRVFQQQYLSLMVMHLALLAWAGVGVVALQRHGDAENRFAFLVKSLEAFVVGGLFAIAGGLFTGITFGLFDALGIQPPEVVMRMFVAGGAGLIAILAVALVYDPAVEPARQSFDEGLSKLVALLLRLLLPLAVVVLVIYLGFIPFNFREPFENRDVLIIFNAMLFAVIALLVGATPVRNSDLDARMQTWLRRGIIALAVLALLIGVYALAAIVYRTGIDRLTPNRLTFIGWNIINIGLLGWLLIGQWRAGREKWLPAAHSAFAGGTIPYVIWSLVVLLALPWLFRGDQGQVANLPARIQNLVYEEPYPILLKCSASPHIYLLEDGAKRWIKDIPTFKAEGYVWRDVRYVSCEDLRAVPDAAPIPVDAGPPPIP